MNVWTPTEALRTFEQDGAVLLRNFAGADLIEALKREHDRLAAEEEKTAPSGIRRVLARSPYIRSVAAAAPFSRLMRRILGEGARAVRGVFFDKTAESNWPLAWHQDRSVHLAARVESDELRNWTPRAEGWQAEPPAATLKRMATIRLHLDKADRDNSALIVAKGLHKDVLPMGELADAVAASEVATLEAEAGDAVLMRPLTPHRSEKSRRPARRRVLHLEFASGPAPGGAEWAEAAE